MEHELIVCSCVDLEHQIILTTFDDEPYVYVSVGLRRNHNFWRRLYVAVKYLFGSVINNAYHIDVILDQSAQKQFVKVFETKLNKVR